MKKLLFLSLFYLVGFFTTAMANCGPKALSEALSDSLGVSRVLYLKKEFGAYGTVQHQALDLKEGEVVLSFDDGPDPLHTQSILNALKKECTLASFFMTGEHMTAYPDLARQVRSEGHGVALHSHTHANMAQLSEEDQKKDLELGLSSFEKTFGHAPFGYRFPFLSETPYHFEQLKKRNISIFSIDIGLEDWEQGQTPDALKEKLLSRLKDKKSGIILLHDNQEQTKVALPVLLRALKENNYRVVHIDWR